MRYKIRKIIERALGDSGFSVRDTDKIMTVLAKIQEAEQKALNDSPNIFNDFWGARGPDCCIVQG